MSFRSLLIHRATVRRDDGESTDGFGASSPNWDSSDLNVSTDVPCRLSKETTKQSRGDLETSTASYRCLFLRGADIRDEDRLIIDGEMFRIVGVDTRYSRLQAHHKSVGLERVK